MGTRCINYNNKDLLKISQLSILLLSLLLFNCKEKDGSSIDAAGLTLLEKPIIEQYGYVLNDYLVQRDTVRDGDSFGKILFENKVGYPTIQSISDSVQDVFDTRRIQVGRPYVLLKTKDTTEAAQVFIYEKNKEDYVVVDFQEQPIAQAKSHPVRYVENEVSGIISDNLSSTFQKLGVSVLVAYKMADIYAWTIDFYKLDKGDAFKVIYEEKYVNDSVYAGIGKIRATHFEHRGKAVKAYRFEHDSIPGESDYFEENGNNLRRAFLTGPLKFNRVSSRYNLRRRIKYYGNKVRPHKGTDYAGPVGTPILATADGTVIKSARHGGNGNYVKIRHNGTYATQYLHMQKRIAKVGDFVHQGDVIGTIGMTGNTGGPHVCYRFWKNGKQVDPYKQDLPDSDPLPQILMPIFDSVVQPLKKQLETIPLPDVKSDILDLETTQAITQQSN